VPDTPRPLPDFTNWPSFPFEGDIRVKVIEDPVTTEPPRAGEDPATCTACAAPDEAYIYINERWRVRAMDRPTGLPMVLILESRTHLDLGDLPNMLAAELGVMTVRLERAMRSLDGIGRVHVNRWGDGSAHLHLWFLARPYGRLQLRGTFLSLWDDILPPISDAQWRENLALVAAWLAEFGGTPLAQPPRIDWKAPAIFATTASSDPASSDPASSELASSEPDGAAAAERAGADPANDAAPSEPAEAAPTATAPAVSTEREPSEPEAAHTEDGPEGGQDIEPPQAHTDEARANGGPTASGTAPTQRTEPEPKPTTDAASTETATRRVDAAPAQRTAGAGKRKGAATTATD
jgi:diadenosine tetraphosphate (Ap4A) HIT family hydrolase